MLSSCDLRAAGVMLSLIMRIVVVGLELEAAVVLVVVEGGTGTPEDSGNV